MEKCIAMSFECNNIHHFIQFTCSNYSESYNNGQNVGNFCGQAKLARKIHVCTFCLAEIHVTEHDLIKSGRKYNGHYDLNNMYVHFCLFAIYVQEFELIKSDFRFKKGLNLNLARYEFP